VDVNELREAELREAFDGAVVDVPRISRRNVVKVRDRLAPAGGAESLQGEDLRRFALKVQRHADAITQAEVGNDSWARFRNWAKPQRPR
jgi:rRNA maturation endonuclease Nob1